MTTLWVLEIMLMRHWMTGNMQPVHHTPWMEAMDDSMESYLQTGKTG